METCIGDLLSAIGTAPHRRMNCAFPCNPARPALENKHPHLPRNEDLPPPIASAAEMS